MIKACSIHNGRYLPKRSLAFVSVFFSFLCFASFPQQVSAQGFDISNEEFSVTMPGKPEYDKQLGATESDPAVKTFFDSFKFVPQPKKKR